MQSTTNRPIKDNFSKNSPFSALIVVYQYDFKVQFCPVLVLDYEFDFADGQCRFAGILQNCAIADWMKSDMFAYKALQLGSSLNSLKTK